MIQAVWKNWLTNKGPELPYDHRQRLFLSDNGFVVRQRPGSRKAARILTSIMLMMAALSLAVTTRILISGDDLFRAVPGVLVVVVFLILGLGMAFLILTEYHVDPEKNTISFRLGPWKLREDTLDQLKSVSRVDLNWEKDQETSGLLAGALKKSNGVHGCAYTFKFTNGNHYRIGTLQVAREVELFDAIPEELNLPVQHKSIS